MTDCQIAIEGRVGRIVLDSRRALNALTAEMISDLTQALVKFAKSPEVECVVIGSAIPGIFCAGGDIKKIRELAIAEDYGTAMRFFRDEFALNQMIADFPKPYVALIDGVCFGGGMGLSIHGRYRVVTDRAAFAMPEMAIGYFPDVGASYFLSRLAPGVGTWLGLTGQRVPPDLAMKLGLATHCAAGDEIDALMHALSNSTRSVADILDAFARRPTETGVTMPTSLISCFDSSSLPELLSKLDQAPDQAAVACLNTLLKSSAHSAVLTFSLIANGAKRSLRDCLAAELRAAEEAVRHPDFAEGVRAVLIDKDRNPRWRQTVADWRTRDFTPQEVQG